MENNKPYTLETATLRDLQALGAMEKVCFPLDAWPLIEQFGVLVLPGIVRIKAVHGERMAGFIGGDVRKSRGEGWIMTLAVLLVLVLGYITVAQRLYHSYKQLNP